MDWEAAKKELRKKLDPSKVKPPAPGKYGEYVEAWVIIEEANRIFGEDGWSYTLDRLHPTNATQDEQGKFHVGYLAQVTATVGGVARGDVGHGQGHGKSEGDAHDSAVKEAVTDGMKRALRSFGYPLGLALYDKSKANVGVDAPPFDGAGERDRIKGRIDSCNSLGELQQVWKSEQPSICRMEREDPPKFNELTTHKDDAKARLSQEQAA